MKQFYTISYHKHNNDYLIKCQNALAISPMYHIHSRHSSEIVHVGIN